MMRQPFDFDGEPVITTDTQDQEQKLLFKAVAYANGIIKKSASRLAETDVDAASQKLRSNVSFIQHEAKRLAGEYQPGLFMQILIDSCKKFHIGNCREFCFLVLDFLDQNNFTGTATLYRDKDKNHVFLIAVDKYGQEYVIDAWAKKFGKKSELESLKICKFTSLIPLHNGIYTLEVLRERRKWQRMEEDAPSFTSLQSKLKSKTITLEDALTMAADLKSCKIVSIDIFKQKLSEYDAKKGVWKKFTNSSTKTIEDFKLLLHTQEKNNHTFINQDQVELCLTARDSRLGLLRKDKQIVQNSLGFFRGQYILSSDQNLTETEKFIIAIQELFNESAKPVLLR